MNIKLNINEDGMIQTKLTGEATTKVTFNKIESINNQSNSHTNEKNESTNFIKARSKRTIKKSKYDVSILSEEENFDSFESESILERISYDPPISEGDDIVMQGNLLYRYSLNQVELEGCWSMNNDGNREKFSYLFLKEKERLICPINIANMNKTNSSRTNTHHSKEQIFLSICASNLHEAIIIPHNNVFNTILNYLSGEYHGFFMYYDKTIEDRFNLNLTMEDNQVRINGEGTNNLGNFNILGYINFYTTKEDLVLNNDVNSEQILLGEFKLTRLYNAFNPNENYRVIKSFQHRRRKNCDQSDNDSVKDFDF